MSFLKVTRNWYSRFERPISSASLVFGFIFDALTLRRVDTLWENLWIVAHLLIVGLFIILVQIRERQSGDEKNPSKIHFYFVNVLQFFFGGLLSTYLVFYFRSADVFVAWPFILLLILAFIANESLKRHYVRFSFQISLFFLSIYLFLIFLVPVVLHKIGDWVFLLSGFLSLIFILFFVTFLYNVTKNRFKSNLKKIVFLISGIFITINFLYFTNIIPPIPLSLKEAGVYHSVMRNGSGDYVVATENAGWLSYFKMYQDFNKVSGSPVYVYSAIFSPKNLNLTIIHQWQYFDSIKNKWITDSEINLPVVGGRDGGFRTYSMRSNLPAGKWRVNVKTLYGQNIGTIHFKIISTDTMPVVVSEVKK